MEVINYDPINLVLKHVDGTICGTCTSIESTLATIVHICSVRESGYYFEDETGVYPVDILKGTIDHPRVNLYADLCMKVMKITINNRKYKQ